MSLGRSGADQKRARALLALALTLALTVYAFALEEEPYHIDELRQTRAYGHTVAEVAEASFDQGQPPLDPVINSLVQRVLGVDDWKQRLIPALSGIGVMVVLASMLSRSGMKQGPMVSVLVLAGSALLTEVFVYARPYAVPSLLMITYLAAAESWVRRRSRAAAIALFPLAVSLPLSRTPEPLILLVATAGVLLVYRYLGKSRFQGSIWVPIAAATTGVVLAGIPVILRLGSELAGYTASDGTPIAEQLSRLTNDVPRGFALVFPFWPALLVIATLVLASGPARRWLRDQWWVWVLFALPPAFLLGFILSVDPGQPLYSRYFFTWMPAIAVMAALAWEQRSTVFRPVPAIAVGLLLVWIGLTQFQALTTKERGDWQALSETIEANATPDSVVVVEHANPLGAYRPFFYGQPRYLAPEWDTHSPLSLIRNPTLADRQAPLVVALSGPDISVEGWRALKVDDFFTVYTANHQVRGPIGIADSLAAFSAALGDDNGSTLGVAAASVYSAEGHAERACEIIGPLRSSEDLAARLQSVLEAQASPLLGLECPTAMSPTQSETP